MKGWNIFCDNPHQEDADLAFWVLFLFNHVDNIAKIISCIPDTCTCLLCGMFSYKFTARNTLKNHIIDRHKWDEIVDFWIKKMISKSPDEVHNLIHFYSNGEPKPIAWEIFN